jgi:hypothetical protein
MAVLSGISFCAWEQDCSMKNRHRGEPIGSSMARRAAAMANAAIRSGSRPQTKISDPFWLVRRFLMAQMRMGFRRRCADID